MLPDLRHQLLRSLSSAPLLLHPRFLAGLTGILAGKSYTVAPLAAIPAGAEKGMKPWEAWEAVRVTPQGTAIVNMRGMLYAGIDDAFTAWIYNLCRPEAIQSAVEECLSDSKIKAVVFNADTPGGVTTQIAETGEMLAELSSAKLTVTHVSGMCCSAGYWLASQTSVIDAAGSADVGCVGTYAAYYDFTRMLQQDGIDLKLFKAGKHKAMGLPGNPLTKEDEALIQADIDRINARFLATVQSARPGIARADLEGQCFDGEQALAKGFTDSTSRNLAAVLRQLEAR